MRSAALVIAAALLTGWLASVHAAQAPGITFRSSADVVLVPVWVSDRNRQVSGLGAGDFVLTDNGVVQDVTATSAESQPIDVTLVLDTSGSIQPNELATLKSGVLQIARALRETDRVRLLTFAATVTDVFGFLAGGTRLPVERIEGGGLTSFYHALAAALMTVPRTERPQVVFGLSDGLDTLSFLDAGHIASLAPASGAALYLALVRAWTGTPLPAQNRPETGPLREAAVRTGGLLFDNPQGNTLPRLFDRAIGDFRTSYLLSYTPRAVPPDGWHDIVVRTTDSRYTVRARTGYQNR